MRYGKDRLEPIKGAKSLCPQCEKEIIAKCGSIMVWHWAHKSKIDCDPWWEPMSKWHLDWQGCVPKEMREIKIENHRADIKLPSGKVIELQHSTLSIEDMFEREDFYGDMAWIFNGKPFEKSFWFIEKTSQNAGMEYVNFRWRRPREYIVASQKQKYIHFGDRILKVKEIRCVEESASYKGNSYTRKKCTGWGWFLDPIEAIIEIFGEYRLPYQEIEMLKKKEVEEEIVENNPSENR